MPAWPLARIIDYVPEETLIEASALNAIQDAQIGVCTGTLTLKAVVVDGVGGSTAAPLAGTLTLSAVTSGATVPTTSGPLGQFTRGSLATSWIRFMGTGTIERAHNVHGFARTAAGVYTVTLPWTLAHPVVSGSHYASAAGWGWTVSDAVVGGKTVLSVATYKPDLTLGDIDTLSLVIHGDN